MTDTTKTQSTAVPWDEAAPYLTAGYKTAGALNTAKSGFNAYTGETVAPFSDQTQAALTGMWGAASAGNPLAGRSQNAISGILGGKANAQYQSLLANSGNPYWMKAVNSQTSQLGDDISRQYSGLGRYGSGAETADLAKQLGDYRTGALSSHWDQNIANQRGILGDMTQAQLGAVAAAPGAYDQKFAPYQYMAQVGSAYDQQAQAKADEAASKWTTQDNADWNRLGAYNSAIGGGGPTSTTATTSQPSNLWGSVLGGALGGASLFGVPGAIGGGLLGGLSGLL